MDGRKSKRVLTVDPGMHTGWALWVRSQPAPIAVGLFHAPVHADPETKIAMQFNTFRDVIATHEPGMLYIEGVQLFGSLRSRTAAAKGDLFLLSYIVGGYCALAKRFEIVLPTKWKGQLDKRALAARVYRRLGRRYRDHVTDAVGLGLAVRGEL